MASEEQGPSLGAGTTGVLTVRPSFRRADGGDLKTTARTESQLSPIDSLTLRSLVCEPAQHLHST